MAKRRFRFKKLINFKKWFTAISKIWMSVVPTLAVVAAFTGLFFAVKNGVYADQGLLVRQTIVEPRELAGDEAIHKISKQVIGKNILVVDLKEIEGKLENNPTIQNVSVERQLPSTIRIRVDSRKPMALIQLAPGSKYGLVTQDGMIIDVFDRPKDPYVVIEAFQGKLHQVKIGLRIDDKGFTEVIHFLKAYWDHAISFQEPLHKVMIDKYDNITIMPIEGPEIRLGRKPMDKIGYLDKIVQLLNQQDRQEIEYVNLQFDNMIIKRRG